MPVTILALPDDEFRDIELNPDVVQAATRSGYTGGGQVSDDPWHTRWLLSAAHVPIVGEVGIRPWRVLQSVLRGRANKFRFVACDFPQGPVGISAAVFGAAQNLPRNTLRIQLVPGDVPGFPEAGMCMTIMEQLVRLTASVYPAGQPANVRDVTFEAPLRRFAANAVAIETRNPWGVFELSQPLRIRGGQANVPFSFAIEAEEYFVRD